MERLQVLAQHLSESKDIVTEPTGGTEARRFPMAPDDIVVVAALRTPIGKSKKGMYVNTHGSDLLAMAFTAVLESVKLNPADLGDICVGCVIDPSATMTARFAQYFSGIPHTVPISSVNRYCSSGLQAFMNIAGGIRNKSYSLAMAGGLEMMSQFPPRDPPSPTQPGLNPRVFQVPDAKDSLIPMGMTSEVVASRYGISRQAQDEFAVQSHKKAAKATKLGYFKAEMIPVTIDVTDKSGVKKTVTVTQDEGIRENTNMEVLSKLRPAFSKDGSTTAGNASQTSDGAAAVLVASRSEAKKRGLPVLGTLRAFAVTGVAPDEMGIGPAVAIPEALKMAGLTVGDIDIYEINEAFASQAVYCVQKLGIPINRVNPKGGAIAFGHPLGCTGSRMIGTLLHELKRRRKRGLGVVSMCIGTGMGAAAIFEYNP